MFKFLLLFFIPIVSFADIVTFSSSGNFLVPNGVTQITVYAWGAGGGGALNNTAGRAGGGGGAFAARMSVPVTPGNSYLVTVGQGGVAAEPNGADGEDTYFVGDSGVTVLAKGGQGAQVSLGGAGGLASSSIGDLGILFSGGNGGNGFVNAGGGGGAGAGTQAAGANGVAGLGVTGGVGGVGAYQGGSGAKGGNFQASAALASAPGGGGGGIGRWGDFASDGARGQIVISYESTTDVAYTGQVLTDAMGLPGGGIVYRPMPPSINPNGKMSFKLYAKAGVGAITANNDSLLMSNSSGSLRVLAQEGYYFTPNDFFKGHFVNIHLTPSGQTLTTETTYSLLTSKNEHAILSSPEGESLDMLIKTGDALGGGKVWRPFHGKSVVDSDENYYFIGLLDNISNKRNSAIWRIKPDSTIEEVVQSRKGADVSALLGRPAWASHLRPTITAGGNGVAYVMMLQNNPDNNKQRTLPAKNEVALVSYNDGSARVLLERGDSLAALGGAKVRLITGISRSVVDTHTLMVNLDTPVPASQHQALLFEDQGTFQLIAQRGVTPIADGLTAQRFEQFYTTTTGAVIFRALLNGATAATDRVICRWTAVSGIEVLIREGSPAPGTDGMNFGVIQRMSVSPNGNILVGSTIGAKKWGIFRNTGAGFLPIIKTGDLVTHAGVSRPALAVSILWESFGVDGGGGGLAEGINDQGQVGVSISLGSGIHLNRLYQ